MSLSRRKQGFDSPRARHFFEMFGRFFKKESSNLVRTGTVFSRNLISPIIHIYIPNLVRRACNGMSRLDARGLT